MQVTTLNGIFTNTTNKQQESPMLKKEGVIWAGMKIQGGEMS